MNYLQNGKDANRFDQEIQQYILLAYAADMGKYTISAAESAKIAAVFNSIPRQLTHENPKFSYREVRKGGSQRDFHLPLSWLVSSGMVNQVCKCEIPQMPLKVFSEAGSFKVYMSDTGLLCCAGGMKIADLFPQSSSLIKAAVTENYVVQSLAAEEQCLHYYKPDATMDIDLLLEGKSGIIPVEIQAGRNRRSRSLINYREKVHPEKMVRLSENNFGKAGELLFVPLYAACLLHNL